MGSAHASDDSVFVDGTAITVGEALELALFKCLRQKRLPAVVRLPQRTFIAFFRERGGFLGAMSHFRDADTGEHFVRFPNWSVEIRESPEAERPREPEEIAPGVLVLFAA